MDVFSAGLVLAEMLTGKRLVQEKDPYRAMYRVINEQLALPEDISAAVDDQLRAIVLRALARDPQVRFPSVCAFQTELEQWGKPTQALESTRSPRVSGASSAQAAAAEHWSLLRRMRHKVTFLPCRIRWYAHPEHGHL